MSRRFLASVISVMLLAALVGGAGCGSEGVDQDLKGKRSAREGQVRLSDYVAAAKETCRSRRDEMSAVADDLEAARQSGDPASLLPVYRRAVARMDSMFKELAALEKPAGWRQELGRLDRLARSIVERYEGSAEALVRGDVDGAVQLAQRGQGSAITWINGVGTFELEVCARTIEGFEPAD